MIWAPRSLRTRLRRQFLLMGVAPVLAVFAASWALLTPLLVQQAESRNRELALAVGDQVRLQLETRVRSAGVLANALSAAPSAVEAAQRALPAVLAGDPFLQAALVVDADDRVIAAALPPQSGRFAEDLIGLDLRSQPNITEARRDGAPVWSDTFLSTVGGEVTVALALPAGQRMVLLELSLAELSRSVTELAQTSPVKVVIVDRNGHVVAHPDKGQALQHANLSNLALVKAALGGTAGSARAVQDGTDQLSYALPVAPIGWAVIVSQPVTAVMAPVVRLGAAVLGVVVAAVLLAIFVGWRLSRHTGNEVSRLADGAQEAASEGRALPDLRFSNAEFTAVWTRLRDLFQQLRVRGEQTLAAKQDLQAVLDAATEVAVIATDSEGRVTVFNIGAQRMLGYRAGEAVGQLTPLAWHDPAELAARGELLSRQHGQAIAGVEVLFVEARRSGYEVRDWRVMHRDGRVLDVSLAMTAMRTPEGNLKGFLGVAIDVAERRRAAELEVARKAAEGANQAKSEFLSQMSHELRTPLNAVLGYAQLLENDPDQPPTAGQLKRVQHIQHAGWHLVRLIDDVLDLARIESGRLAVTIAAVDLGPLLTQVGELVAVEMRQYSVAYSWAMEGGDASVPARVAADPTRLTQVLVNLLSNAAKYNRPQGSVRLSCRTEGQTVCLSITDTGRGLTADQLAHLYEPFNRLGRERTTIAGTGIGLVITRHLVGLMGGQLDVQSVPDVGTTFSLTLQVAAAVDATESPLPLQGNPLPPAPAQGRVLYIEDNEVNAQLMRAMLRQRPDVELQIADQVSSGLSAARSARPDLILLDLHLPDGDGQTVLAALHADPLLRDVPVVIVSADATRSQMDAFLQLGVVAYLTKPLNVNQVLGVVDQALATRTAGH